MFGELILVSVLVLGGLGLLLGFLLAAAYHKLRVVGNPKAEEIEKVLSGVNCGACGYASCRDYAEKVAKGEAHVSGCVAGGHEVASKIAEIMGVEMEATVPLVAVIHCGADRSIRTERARYYGIETCGAAELVGGNINCTYGCLGFGDCYRACPFGAIEMANGLPRITLERCTACGKCVETCPRDIISLEEYRPEAGLVAVACNSQDKGPEVRKICKVGCIACKLCEKVGPEGLFVVTENLAKLDYSRFQNSRTCKKAIERCPTQCILELVAPLVTAYSESSRTPEKR